MVVRAVRRLNGVVDRWLLAPESNAAGRMGIYRILFCAFYLWFLSYHFGASLSGLPDVHHRPTLLVEPLLKTELSPLFFELLESGLVAALVVLLIGYRVRLATAAVLILGSLNEALYMSVEPEKATVMLAFYIPLIMLFAGRWGRTYSLDSLLDEHSGRPRVAPSDSSGTYFLAARALLLVLAFLFFSAALVKVAFGGTWLAQPELLSIVLVENNVELAVLDLPVNPLAPAIAESSVATLVAPYSTLVFESLFFLALFDRDLRQLILAAALIFHSVSALWLGITFTPVLIAYALFVDWESLRQRIAPRRLVRLDAANSSFLVAAVLTLALATGALWDLTTAVRDAVNLGGFLDWRTIFYPVLPLAVVWFFVALRNVLWRIRWTARPVGAPPY